AKAGQITDGLATIAKALEGGEQRGERVFAAELYRLRGELTLAQSGVRRPASSVKKGSRGKVQGAKLKNTDPRPLTPNPQSKTEACFLKAIEIARQQNAKSLELRAIMSLVRLHQQQAPAPQGEDHRVLSEVYNWFTEGFNTADLQEAKALLE